MIRLLTMATIGVALTTYGFADAGTTLAIDSI
jgi:hypothetical protein